MRAFGAEREDSASMAATAAKVVARSRTEISQYPLGMRQNNVLSHCVVEEFDVRS